MSQRLYKISEIAAKHGLTLRTLRFWEDKDLLRPERKGTTRLYTDADDARIGRIAHLRAAGFAIEDIWCIFDLEDRGLPDSAARLLTGHHAKLVDAAEAQVAALRAIGESLAVAA